MHAAFHVGLLRHRPEPAVVVEGRRHRHRRRFLAARLVEAHADADDAQFAQAAVAHQFARLAEGEKWLFRTLLRTGLQNHLFRAHGLPQRDGFVDAVGDGLLHVEVLARQGRLHGDERVPVVGRADDHGVDLRPREDLVEIVAGFHVHVRFALLLVELHDGLPRDANPSGIEVAHGHHPGQRVGQGALEVAGAHATAADMREVDAPVGRGGAVGRAAEEARQHDQAGAAEEGVFDEGATGEVVHNKIRGWR